jgi:hypothetical protein
MLFSEAAGYFATADQIHELKTDPDLAPLRARDKFQKLLAEVEAKAEPML